MITREHYEKLFANYPDVISLKEFRLMLGGITEKTALKILEHGKVKFFFIRRRHLIPKICIIDYLLGVVFSSHEVRLISQEPGKRHKPGPGCLYQINDYLLGGKYSLRNTYGKRITKNVYARTREACEKKLMVLIAQMDQENHRTESPNGERHSVSSNSREQKSNPVTGYFHSLPLLAK